MLLLLNIVVVLLYTVIVYRYIFKIVVSLLGLILKQLNLLKGNRDFINVLDNIFKHLLPRTRV